MKFLVPSLASLALASALTAAPQTFDFKDPKGVNNVAFKLDAPLEAIQGSGNGISGTVEFDPANPTAAKGRIVLATKSLQVPNPLMKEHMDGAQWMDVATHPEIVFELKSIRNLKTSGDVTTGDAIGTLTIKGVSKELVTHVTATYLKDKLAARTNGQMKGDLLVLRTSFEVFRTQYGINPGAPQDKVADKIELSLSIAGAAPKP